MVVGAIGGLGGLGALMLAGQAMALSPTNYIFLPKVEEGEKEIEIKAGTSKHDGRESAFVAGFGIAVNSFWFTEVSLKAVKEPGRGSRYDGIEFENKFQLTETGKFPIDIGLFTELEIPRESSEGREVSIAPLFQTEFGKTQLNLNFVFERRFGGQVEPGERRKTEFNYQLQAKYRLMPAFEFGLQAFGELGELSDIAPKAEQAHKFGPAVFGKIDLGGRQKIKYNLAYLFGKGEAPKNTIRTQVEYEF